MLENVVEPIPSLKSVRNQSERLKTRTGTALIYDKYSEILILAEAIHYQKIKYDYKFSSKTWKNVYELKKIPNDNDDD